jgi:hypothetical protein
MLDYEIAIPSHDRTSEINQHTLRYLADTGIPKEKIRIFVAPDQYDAYKENVDAGLYNELIPTVLGLRGNRNAITEFYPEGIPLVQADDDVRYIGKWENEKTLTRIEDLPKLIEECFTKSDLVGATLWGFYPVSNPFFMKPRERYGLSFISGQFYGLYNRREEMLGAETKSDYERAILRFIADGIILRFEDLTTLAGKVGGAKGGNKGGWQSLDRAAMNEQGTDYLLATYPDFVTEKKSRDNGYREIKLRDV